MKIWINMSHYDKMWWYWVVATNIINELLVSYDYEFYLFNNTEFSLPKGCEHKSNIHKVITQSSNYIFYRLFTQWQLIKKYDIDCFFTPDQIVPLKKHCKYISTIHDLYTYMHYIWFRAFHFFKEEWLKKWLRLFLYNFLPLDKIFAKNSDYIITPSTNSKNDIIKCFDVNPDKVIVSYRWIDNIKEYDVSIDDMNYVLFPLCDCYFSDYLAFRIWKEIINRNIVDKVFYWKPWWIKYDNFKQFEHVDRFIISKKRLSEEEKYNLIKNSKCCIYISKFEWFWFVPLECLKIWAPLLYYNVWSLDEVIWKYWIATNDTDVDDFVNNLDELILNQNKIKSMIKDWIKWSNKYTRKGTVEKIVQCFNI